MAGPYCATCANELQAVTTEDFVSQDNWGGDYYTHYCSICPSYWHLHIDGRGGVDLISTKANQEYASKKIKDNLVVTLREKATELEKV